MSVLLVGIGSAGIGVVDDIYSKLGYAALAASTDQSSLDATGIERKLLLGPQICQGESASSAAQALEAALESSAEIVSALDGHQQLVLVAALGGGTASGAVGVIAELAQKVNARVLILAALPFSFEPQQRAAAEQVLKQLQQQYQVLVLDNEQQTAAGDGLDDIFAVQSARALELIRQQLG